MADTLGNVIDKLVTVDMKMWDNQELLYEIRRMSFEDYKEKLTSRTGAIQEYKDPQELVSSSTNFTDIEGF